LARVVSHDARRRVVRLEAEAVRADELHPQRRRERQRRMLVREQDAPCLHDGLRLPGAAGLQEETGRPEEALPRRHAPLKADVADRLPAGSGSAVLGGAHAGFKDEARWPRLVVQAEAVVRRLHRVSQLRPIRRRSVRPGPLETILRVGRAFAEEHRGTRDLASGARRERAVALHAPAGQLDLDEEELGAADELAVRRERESGPAQSREERVRDALRAERDVEVAVRLVARDVQAEAGVAHGDHDLSIGLHRDRAAAGLVEVWNRRHTPVAETGIEDPVTVESPRRDAILYDVDAGHAAVDEELAVRLTSERRAGSGAEPCHAAVAERRVEHAAPIVARE